jgi:hypothetical protein
MRHADESVHGGADHWAAPGGGGRGGGPGSLPSRRVTKTTLCRWRTKSGGMQVSEAHRLKELEAEATRRGLSADPPGAEDLVGNGS